MHVQQGRGETRQLALLAAHASRCIHPSSFDILPGISSEQPYPDQHPYPEYHQQHKLSPGFHRFRFDRRQIPLRERPHKLAVQPNQRQGSDKEHHQSECSNSHRVKQHHRPVIDTVALWRLGHGFHGYSTWNSGSAPHRRLQTGRAASGTHGRSGWRRRAHIFQPTMTPPFYTATRSTCTAAHHRPSRPASDNVVTTATHNISYPDPELSKELAWPKRRSSCW